jgi:hypothetical protein
MCSLPNPLRYVWRPYISTIRLKNGYRIMISILCSAFQACLVFDSVFALNCCVHYLCLTGWGYLFYVGHTDKIMKPISML